MFAEHISLDPPVTGNDGKKAVLNISRRGFRVIHCIFKNRVVLKLLNFFCGTNAIPNEIKG